MHQTLPRPVKTPYMCEIILTGKATVTVDAEPCQLLFKSLNVSFPYPRSSLVI